MVFRAEKSYRHDVIKADEKLQMKVWKLCRWVIILALVTTYIFSVNTNQCWQIWNDHSRPLGFWTMDYTRPQKPRKICIALRRTVHGKCRSWNTRSTVLLRFQHTLISLHQRKPTGSCHESGSIDPSPQTIFEGYWMVQRMKQYVNAENVYAQED